MGSDNGAVVAPWGKSAYLISQRVGLYIKYSTNRLSPWRFSFNKRHQDQVAHLAEVCDHVFVALVCGPDGIACLSWSELTRVLDADRGRLEWIRAARRAREKYSIAGSDDRRGFKVADKDFPSKVLAVVPQRALGHPDSEFLGER